MSEYISHELGRLHAGMSASNSWKPLVKRLKEKAHELEQRDKRTRAFVTDVLNCTRFTPGVVNHGHVLRLLQQHLPELMPATMAPGEAEGAHGAGLQRTTES